MLTTGQLTKKVGIETNTMIRWLREGILIPEPGQGRNKAFSFEEALVGRAIAPLYQEWSLKAELLKGVAEFFRGMLSVRAELGYTEWRAFEKDIQLWRAKGLLQLLKSGTCETDYNLGVLKGAQAKAKQRGVELPENWFDDSVPVPDFSGEFHARVSRYDRIIDNMFGLDDWQLFVARNSEGEWNWAVSDYKHFRSEFQSDAASYIAVDLAKALSD